MRFALNTKSSKPVNIIRSDDQPFYISVNAKPEKWLSWRVRHNQSESLTDILIFAPECRSGIISMHEAVAPARGVLESAV